MRRLTGLLLIVRTLAPVLAVLTIYWGYTRIIDDFQIALKPIQTIEQEMGALGATIDTAREQFETARAEVESAVQIVQRFRVPDILPNLSTNLSIPSIEIPSITVPVLPTVNVRFSNATGSVSRTIDGACHTVFDFLGIGKLVCDPVKTVTESLSFSYPSGITLGTTNYTFDFPTIPSFNVPMPAFFNTVASQLEGVFSAFDSVFGRFEQTFSQVTALGQKIQAIPDQIAAIGSSGQQLMGNLSTVVEQRGGLVMAALIITVILIVISFVVGALDDFMRGLRLLLGRG